MRGWAVLALGIALGGCAQVLGIDHTYERDDAAGDGGASASSASGQGGLPEPPCQDAACDDKSVCTTDICIEATDLCEHVAVPDGPAPGVADMPNDCMDRVCQGGVEQVVPDDDEVPPDDMNPCTDQMCAGGVAVTTLKPPDTVCGQGMGGIELVCNAMGICVGCTKDDQCPNAPECQSRNCTNDGQCIPENAPEGTSCGAGDVCDGAGTCMDCVNDGDCNVASSLVCDRAAKTCVLSCPDGIKNGAETDVDCGGAACPDCSDGKVCSAAGDCSSNVCQMNLCRPVTCANMVKDGTETDVDCGGQSAPTCQKCANGLSCMVNADCVSNNCSAGMKVCQ
jgi:hypothetical protein